VIVPDGLGISALLHRLLLHETKTRGRDAGEMTSAAVAVPDAAADAAKAAADAVEEAREEGAEEAHRADADIHRRGDADSHRRADAGMNPRVGAERTGDPCDADAVILLNYPVR
jgi:hypothetical protein